MPHTSENVTTCYMSIEAKHAYRFGYLKSEEWKTVRIEALARERGRCQICGDESVFNDAHHIWYPEDIYDTTAKHLAVLCRPCHDFMHAMRPECKTRDEEKGRSEWTAFQTAVGAWVYAKRQTLVFQGGSVADLRKAYNELKAKNRDAHSLLPILNAAKRLSEQLEQFQKAVDGLEKL